MDVTVTDARDHKRYEARVDGVLAAIADYIPTDELLAFTHTEVMPEFEGKGVGSMLIRHALDDVRRQQLAVLAVCPFVSGFVQRHPEYGDLLYRSRTRAVVD
ncbi:N-acetyltransferase [Blastococcus sp. TBT05-19]|uniref:GNAT family N-acetyltransferase n=1 Tax=Blastococcus sp. TBT05-19 TaxID=2250581 RepID=UPI000DE9011B|nr:GNAT family N-acetyltransferase [Blastococcus sp. TBT05-19]RBY90229.1 N-acetyltransferase [Blastococcus sp. TBT05-19]